MSRNKVFGDFGLPEKPQLTRADLVVTALFAAIGAAALSAALTAWFAHGLGYRAVLGSPWFTLRHLHIYAPWKWMTWRAALAEHYPASHLVTSTSSAHQMILVLSLGIAAIALKRRVDRRRNRVGDSYGSAHWATPDEVRRTGTLGQQHGLFLADWYDPQKRDYRYLRQNRATHSMVVGPTRCGKDVGCAVSTVLAETESTVVLDPKGDLWKLTSGALQKRGHRVMRLSLGEEPSRSARTNPLARIRLRTFREIPDAQLLAASLLAGKGEMLTGNNAIFAAAATPVLTACLLHVLYREEALGNSTASMIEVAAEFLSTRSYDEVLFDWHKYQHDPKHAQGWRAPDGSPTATHPMIAAVAVTELMCADKKLKENVRFAIRSALALFFDSTLTEILSEDDFAPQDLVNGDRPTALYLVYPFKDKERLSPILRVLLEQIVDRLTEEMDVRDGKPVRPHKYKLHLLLNEFAAIGRMPVLEAALPICASFGIRASIFIQNVGQLHAAYGPEEQVSKQCEVRVVYPPNDFASAEEVSKMLGTHTVQKKVERELGERGARDQESESGRALIAPDELLRMKRPEKYVDEDGEERIRAPGDVIVWIAGHPPLKKGVKQILYWQDPVMAQLVQLGAAPCTPRLVRPPRACLPPAAPTSPSSSAPPSSAATSSKTSASPLSVPAPSSTSAPPPFTPPDAEELASEPSSAPPKDPTVEDELAWLAGLSEQDGSAD